MSFMQSTNSCSTNLTSVTGAANKNTDIFQGLSYIFLTSVKNPKKSKNWIENHDIYYFEINNLSFSAYLVHNTFLFSN
jgi:hypothetical protein